MQINGFFVINIHFLLDFCLKMSYHNYIIKKHSVLFINNRIIGYLLRRNGI